MDINSLVASPFLYTSAIIANGSFENSPFLADKIRSCKSLIAVDGGLNHCARSNYHPDIIIGDFDSVSAEALHRFKNIPRMTYPKEKDKTDLEIALEYANPNNNNLVLVIGALGGRIDHTLTNILLLSLYPGCVFFESSNEILFVINKKIQMQCNQGQTISLIPLNGTVSGISSSGLKWELKHAVLNKTSLGMSNICLSDKLLITVEDGDLLCVLNRSMKTQTH